MYKFPSTRIPVITTYGPSGVGEAVGKGVSVGATVASSVSVARTIATDASVAALISVGIARVCVGSGGAALIPLKANLAPTNTTAIHAITNNAIPANINGRREAVAVAGRT